MNLLKDEGFVRFAGPLAGTESGRVRLLMIADAESEADIHRRLTDDPWVQTGQLVTASIEPWQTALAQTGSPPLRS